MDLEKKSIGVPVDGTLQQIWLKSEGGLKVADVETENTVKYWNGFPSTESFPVIITTVS